MDLSKIRSSAGRIGGITTLLRYGLAHYREIGKQGGRPRQLSVDELLSGKQKEERPSNDLRVLKSLYARKIKGEAF